LFTFIVDTFSEHRWVPQRMVASVFCQSDLRLWWCRSNSISRTIAENDCLWKLFRNWAGRLAWSVPNEESGWLSANYEWNALRHEHVDTLRLIEVEKL
jgi:hypothetical protein